MPAADDLISDFDDFHESQPQPEPTEPASLPTKKSKKKKKHGAQARARLDEEDDTSYAKSVTPSPPTNLGVRLDTPPPALQDLVTVLEPEFDEVAIADEPDQFAWGDGTTAAEHDENTAVEPPEPPVKPPPPQSPAVRSPRPAKVKPLSSAVSPPYRTASSHKLPQPYPGRGSYRSNNAVAQPTPQRRESFVRSPRPRDFDPPPPHMPQPHFFTVPDLGLGMPPKAEKGVVPGSDGYCCRFDTFADAGDAASARRAKDALLVGSECGLDVYKVLLDEVKVAGRLEGLRGAVIDAKVLPHTSVYDGALAIRPLVAVIVHGPVNDERRQVGGEGERDPQAKPTLYQTTVEVYSLKTQKHVATLYKSTTVKMEVPVVGHLSLPPKPVGELHLDAAGKFVTLASGVSGEVFVFTGETAPGDGEPSFRCIAKHWTALQTRPEAPRPLSANGSSSSDVERDGRTPLLSLSARWLVIVPPYSSPGSSIQGSPTISDDRPQPYGAASHSAPLQPQLTCEVTGIDAEGTLSWLSRKAAQGLVTASQRGIEMSVQGWKELTYPSPPSAHAKSNSEPSMFPPTNVSADDPRRLAKEPALVSVIDLQMLLDAEEQRLKQLPPPLATFAFVDGCNYVSFSSDGLRLMTSNRKGEVSSIWDLGHVAHGSVNPSPGDEAQAERVPHIKLIHRIARSSPSVIVDSAWSREGDWLALLTAQGTVHLHDVPFTAPRKRKRRATMSAPVSDKAEASISLSHGVSPPSNGFIGGLRSWTQTLSTQVNTVKTQYSLPTTFAGFKDTATAARAVGQRAVARGISQGYTAAKSGASDMWHAEDNKIRIKPVPEGGAKGCIRWVQLAADSRLALVCDGTVLVHAVERVERQRGDVTIPGLKRDKRSSKFPLARINTSREGVKATSCAKQGPHGFWGLQAASSEHGKVTRVPSGAVPVPMDTNQIETNPPFCPWHVDPRINIFAFEDSAYASQIDVRDNALLAFKTRGHGYEEEEGEPWLFGGPLPASINLNERLPNDDRRRTRVGVVPAELESDDDIAGMIESRLSLHPAAEGGGEEIRIQSKRSRGRGHLSHAREREEEGGFQFMGDDGDDADDSMM